MSGFFLLPDPAHDQQAFANRIQAILDRSWPTAVALGPTCPQPITGWIRDPDARVILLLEGRQRIAWRSGPSEADQDFVPGEAVWFAPGAAMREDWSQPCHFLSIVLRPQFLRLLVGRCRGDGRHPGASPWAFHSTIPLGQPGLLVARALDQLADGRGDPAAAGELVRVFLRLAREHASRYADSAPSRSAATWQRVQEHVAANCHREIDRAGTAQALGLNPTYLSELCARHSGEGFVGLVESIRLERGRLLLRQEAGLPIAEVARRVGFASAGYFARVFRRAHGTSPGRWRAT